MGDKEDNELPEFAVKVVAANIDPTFAHTAKRLHVTTDKGTFIIEPNFAGGITIVASGCSGVSHIDLPSAKKHFVQFTVD